MSSDIVHPLEILSVIYHLSPYHIAFIFINKQFITFLASKRIIPFVNHRQCTVDSDIVYGMCVVHNTVSDNLLCIDTAPNLRIRNEETLLPIISTNHFIFLVLHHFLQSTERNHKTATIGNILIKRQFSVTLCKRQDIKRIETIQSILRQFLE